MSGNGAGAPGIPGHAQGIEPYDLVAPVHLLLPISEPTLDYGSPQWEARQAHLAAEREALEQVLSLKLIRAMQAWEGVWDRVEQNVVATSVLLIHKPHIIGYSTNRALGCIHCEQYNGYEDTEPMPWPCPTYAAVAQAAGAPVADTPDGVH